MSDTPVQANPGTGGASFAADLDGSSVTWPYAKLAWGASGTQTEVAAGASALPISDGGNSITVDGTVAVSGTVTISGAVTNAGTFAVQATQAGTWNIATVTAVTAITNALPAGANVIGHVITDTGSTTAVTGNVTVTQATGTNLHMVVDSGTITTVSTVTAVTAISNALPAGTNNIGGVTQQPLSTGGLSIKSFVSANSNNKASVGAPCRIYFITVFNISSAPVYLKCFNAASGSVTAGTTACDFQFACPANSTAANGAGTNIPIDASGISMGTDFTYLLTTGIGTTDNTSVAANIAIVTMGYK